MRVISSGRRADAAAMEFNVHLINTEGDFG